MNLRRKKKIISMLMVKLAKIKSKAQFWITQKNWLWLGKLNQSLEYQIMEIIFPSIEKPKIEQYKKMKG
jgi:hypothetical protein